MSLFPGLDSLEARHEPADAAPTVARAPAHRGPERCQACSRPARRSRSDMWDRCCTAGKSTCRRLKPRAPVAPSIASGRGRPRNCIARNAGNASSRAHGRRRASPSFTRPSDRSSRRHVHRMPTARHQSGPKPILQETGDRLASSSLRRWQAHVFLQLAAGAVRTVLPVFYQAASAIIGCDHREVRIGAGNGAREYDDNIAGFEGAAHGKCPRCGSCSHGS